MVAEETILGRAVIEKGERHDGHGGNDGEHAALDAETAPVEQVSNRVALTRNAGTSKPLTGMPYTTDWNRFQAIWNPMHIHTLPDL